MAYSDAPHPPWDHIVGFTVWFVTGFLFLDPLSRFFLANCLSESCEPSLGWRLAGWISTAYIASALIVWPTSALLKRFLYGRAR